MEEGKEATSRGLELGRNLWLEFITQGLPCLYAKALINIISMHGVRSGLSHSPRLSSA